VFGAPRHPYTKALLSAIPKPDPRSRTEAVSLGGELPDPSRPPPGCALATRCPIAIESCSAEHPERRPRDGREVRCLLA
jgi:oligopeptide/dipeptide ABC transporter ATP-binding protein